MPKRGSGVRGGSSRIKTLGPGRPPTKETFTARLKSVSLPETIRDNELVTCSVCDLTCTYREFRFHNIESHYNVAKTEDDVSVIDHKFLVRKLLEMARLLKLTTFFCPQLNCESSYKSALGLAYHMQTCGRTADEVEAILVECDICHKKFTFPNLTSHKRSQHAKAGDDIPTPSVTGKKRKSAMKALEFMKEVTETGEKDACDDDELSERDENFQPTTYHKKLEQEDEIEDEEEEERPNNLFVAGNVKESAEKHKPDFIMRSAMYFENNNEASSSCETAQRITEDILLPVITIVNPIHSITDEEVIRNYLPIHEQSVPFATKSNRSSQLETTEFRRLEWFGGETIDCISTNFIMFAGGSVLDLAWHPSAEYLAVSTLKSIRDEPTSEHVKNGPGIIQIYFHPGAEKGLPSSVFSLELILTMDFGYIRRLKWSPYCPVSTTPTPTELSEIDVDRIGYLAAVCEDSTVRIMCLRHQDFVVEETFSCRNTSEPNVRVYNKIPEITLWLEEDLKLETGQCTAIDWDDGSRYIVTGYTSGQIAVFDLLGSSTLIKTEGVDSDGNNLIYLNPIWTFRGHACQVSSLVFFPNAPHLFSSGSHDRNLQTWDVNLRQEIESKRVGSVVDMTWIRGWSHIAVSVETALTNCPTQFNFLKFYPVGYSTGRIQAFEYFDVTSISSYNGMLLCGTEAGRVYIAYLDSYWKECDYERQKKKKNTVNLCRVTLDESKFTPIEQPSNAEAIQPLPTDEPYITFNISNERIVGGQEAEPTSQHVENLLRYYPFVRVNKVCWSPGGKFVTIGYRSGLIAILPISFEELFLTKK